MAKVTFEEALENETLDLADKFLVVETKHDGYTNTHLGQYAFRVIKETTGEEGAEEHSFKVFPVYLREDDVYVNEKYPVIQTDGNLVFFSKNTTIDPYGFTYPGELEVKEGQAIETVLLHAFEGYVKDAFRLSAYHIMLDDGRFVEDDAAIPFEQINQFERDVIHPWSGTYRADEIL